MPIINHTLSTGLPGFDKVIRGLIPGDNIVWQVDSIASYQLLVHPFCERAKRSGRSVIYFHFASHPPLVEDDPLVHTLHLDPRLGFEEFIDAIHSAIEAGGRGTYYIFDCLSDLAAHWYSDEMLGNFFLLTCPYLYDLETIAYFGLLRDHHSFHATEPIGQTTQLLLNVHRHCGKIYVHPQKVQQRHSPTMYMLHAWEGDSFEPVTDSATISEVMQALPRSGISAARQRLGVWSRTFQKLEELLDTREAAAEDQAETEADFARRIFRMMISRDERVLQLLERYLSVDDVVQIHKRMIGTGLIGGKAVGMLLARAVLRRESPRWEGLLEAHDSFFIGSDVFYTYLVRNGCWWAHQRTRKSAEYIRDAVKARQRILRGVFPAHITRQFEDLLDYFGQSPIIVRSSSLLEDNFGNAFAGKYESVFCPNQGSRERCREDFLAAVRTIYASALSEKALTYRDQKGILDRDEQMALLVQRVSGDLHHHLHYPQMAGVGFSYNPYAWEESILPEAGMLRLVFGLGTRAVDRSDDDYTRIVSLSAPAKRPETGFDDVRRYAQRRVDVLDLDANQLLGKHFEEVAADAPERYLELYATRDTRAERSGAGPAPAFPWVLTFDQVLAKTHFVDDMREMLGLLQTAYQHPVDVEFTANFQASGACKINLVQCRPMQIQSTGAVTPFTGDVPPELRLLEACGGVIGRSRQQTLHRVIHVHPYRYGTLPLQQRYAVARAIGRLVRLEPADAPQGTLLVGPGRWGTTTPALGVPVSFSEISRVAAVCEVVHMREDLVPDVSLGTHFFSDLVELEILYLALFPDKPGNRFNLAFFENAPNRLAELLPDDAGLAGVLGVVDVADLKGMQALYLHADTLQQRVICYLEPVAAAPAP